jgi:hypothetical protein
MIDETDDIGRVESGDRVQEAYDYFGGRSAFIIADIAIDDAWIAVPEGQEASVDACR